MQEEGSTDWKRVNEPDKLLTTCECVVPNLKELKKYRFRVKAVNEAGESEPSDTTGEIPATDIQGTSPLLHLCLHLLILMNFLKICQLHFFDKSKLNPVLLFMVLLQRHQKFSLILEHKTV